MFWVDDFLRMHHYFDNFEFQLILSQPPEGWPLCSGHVTEYIKNELKLGVDWGVYLCGNKAMIEETSQLVQIIGVLKEQVHFEKFF